MAPFITMRSGAPYDVTLGYDLFGDNGTARADLVSAAGASCTPSGTVVCTKYGGFSTIASAASLGNMVPKNYLTMAGLVSVNMRLYRVFGFGPSPRSQCGRRGGRGAERSRRRRGSRRLRGWGPAADLAAGAAAAAAAPAGCAWAAAAAGAAVVAMTTEHRYNVTVGVNFTNMLNHFNPGGYVGDHDLAVLRTGDQREHGIWRRRLWRDAGAGRWPTTGAWTCPCGLRSSRLRKK